MGSRTTSHLKQIKEKKPKRATPLIFNEYNNLGALRVVPIPDSFIEKLAHDLLNWAQSDNALKIGQFCTEKQITRGTFYRLAERNETLANAIKEAHQIIGDRREIGALKQQLNAQVVLKSMSQYDPAWKAHEEWQMSFTAKAQAQAAAESKTIYVTIPENEKSDLVPDPE